METITELTNSPGDLTHTTCNDVTQSTRDITSSSCDVNNNNAETGPGRATSNTLPLKKFSQAVRPVQHFNTVHVDRPTKCSHSTSSAELTHIDDIDQRPAAEGQHEDNGTYQRLDVRRERKSGVYTELRSQITRDSVVSEASAAYESIPRSTVTRWHLAASTTDNDGDNVSVGDYLHMDTTPPQMTNATSSDTYL